MDLFSKFSPLLLTDSESCALQDSPSKTASRLHMADMTERLSAPISTINPTITSLYMKVTANHIHTLL